MDVHRCRRVKSALFSASAAAKHFARKPSEENFFPSIFSGFVVRLHFIT
jgi:hypothetical protein